MVGCCGVVGGGEHSIERMGETLAWTGDERSFDYRDDGFRLKGFTHRRDRESPGQSPNGDALVWVWGNVLGFEGDDDYRPRDPDANGSAADYCAGLYDEHGTDFVAGLNGDFVGMIYDRDDSAVSVFTDRLGSWPLFYTQLADGTLVFSSHVQSLAKYPPVSLEFDVEYVAQHLTESGGPYGVKTPLRDVEAFHPGAVTTIATDAHTVERSVYWRPRFDPVDEPYEHFVDEFVDRFRSSIRERTQDRSKRYGILLSGGSDARLVLGALDDDLDVTAFHMADWMSKEARIAERIAMTKDVEFRFLRRDPAYYERLLERTPAMWNFSQLYNQAWAEGFMDEVRSDVDVLLTGHFCDTMFKGWFVPKRFLHLGPLGDHALPFEQPIDSIEEYVYEVCPTKPVYVDADVSLDAVLSRNIVRSENGIDGYGVEFDSLEDYVLAMPHYPATTDSFFRQSLRENLPLQTPVLDNRLVDLWLTTPTRYQLRRNLVGSAVESIDPELAAIPHADSGVPVSESRLNHWLGYLPMNGLRRLSPFDAPPVDWVGHSPWGDLENLIRHRPFVEEAIREEEDLVRALSFLDWDATVECYRSHLEGEDNTRTLLRLVTFLKAPITRRIADPGEEASVAEDVERDG